MVFKNQQANTPTKAEVKMAIRAVERIPNAIGAGAKLCGR